FKDRELERFGLNPVSMTSASLLLSSAVVVIETIFLFVLPSHVGFAEVVFGLATSWLDYALFAVLLLDTIARYDQVLRGVESPPGFLEWLVKLFWRPRGGARNHSP